MQKGKNHLKLIVIIIVLLFLLLVSVGYIVYSVFFTKSGFVSYLQSKEELYHMECGIIHNCKVLRDGSDVTITYAFQEENYDMLKEKYHILEIAGDGTEFQQALNLMNDFSKRLSHNGSFEEYTKQMNANDILDYALDQPEHGIFCRAKAQIFNEMFLSLNIYSRKLWLNPLSVYDSECHVVNEIWDTGYNKWVMLDTTNNLYWVDENGVPLSVLEIRDKLAEQELVTPVKPDDSTEDLAKLRENYSGFILYTAKNMAYLQYFTEYGEGEAEIVYTLLPENMEPWDSYLISEKTIRMSPVVITLTE